jgi:hypothetical protein
MDWENGAGMTALLAWRLTMYTRPSFRRLTVLALSAVLSGLVGCSMFKEQATPKLSAEVTPGPQLEGTPAAKYVVEIRPEKGKAKSVEKPLSDQVQVQTALEQTGALKKFDRALISVYRPLPSGGWHKMDLEFDHQNHRVPPEYDYAVLPGDRIVVTEDPRNMLDDVMERALKPLGINPPKKVDPIKARYQVQG